MIRFFTFGWLKAARRHFYGPSKSDRCGKRLRSARCTPRLEFLEDRALPSTFTVLNLHDSGPGSLRQAVLSANAHHGADVIDFANGLHGTISLTSGQLSITDDLGIAGPGANQLTVSGGQSSRVFDIGTGKTVALADLTIANGATVGGLGGGGILNEAGATLTLTRMTLNNNTATAGSNTVDVFGGGLLNEGSVTIDTSTFSGNKALGGGGSSFFGGSVGGAIDNFGGAQLMVTGSTFSNNQALGAGFGSFGIGGAIENNAGADDSIPSTAAIHDSLFIDNVASGVGDGVTGNGGALDNEGGGATMTLSNSTFLGNQSLGTAGGEGRGGGILNVFGSQLTVTNSVLASNRAVGGAGAAGTFPDGRGIGGGIDNEVGSTLTVLASTLFGNEARGGDGSTFGGTLATSVVADGAGGGISNGDALFGGATLTVTDSSLIGNLARGGSTNAGRGGTGQGGGINNVAGSLVVSGTMIALNQALGGTGGSTFQAGFGIGGGIDTYGNAAASVIDSTLFANAAIGAAGAAGANGGNGLGGGIQVGLFNVGGSTDNSILTITASTLAFNIARGGDGGLGANGGDGLGGGLGIQAGSSAMVNGSTITRNQASGGEEAGRGSDGHGMGGGVYDLGTFSFDRSTVVNHNHASTSNDDIFP